MYGTHYIGANPSFALDSAQDNKLSFAVAEDLTADRQLDFLVGDANRKIDLTPTADHGLMYDGASATWKSKDIVGTLSSIFKTDGSRDLTGQLVSTYAAGAPLVIADNTMVANLNADLLDGSHASAFASSAHTHTFSQLTDVPAGYAGSSLKLVRVNAGEDALEFTSPVTTTFLALTDVPGNYAGQGDKTVSVNAGATALEFSGPWLDQDVRVAATPTFAGLTVAGNVTLSSCSTFSISDSPGNTSVTMDGTLSVSSTCNIVGLFTANNQIVSTLADGGVMPINVTSAVLCTNLNADLLDDLHSSAFALAPADFADNALIRGDGGGKGIQGSGVLLDDSDNMRLPGTARLQLDNANQYLLAGSSTQVTLNAVTSIVFAIGGFTKATLSSVELNVIDLLSSKVLRPSQATNPSAGTGNLWYNQATKALRFEAHDATHNIVGAESLLTADSTISNTDAKTYFSGTKDFKANSFVVGSCYEFWVSGKLSTDATITYKWNFDLDLVEVVVSSDLTQTSTTNSGFVFHGYFTVRTIGQFGAVMGNATIAYPRGGGAPIDTPSAAGVNTTNIITARWAITMSVAGLNKKISAQQIIIKKIS